MAFPVVETVRATAFSSFTTTHNVLMPATVNAGDYLVCLIQLYESDFDVIQANTPADWNFLSHGVVAGEVGLTVFYKVADGSEDDAAVDFSSGTSTAGLAVVYRVSGATDIEVGTSATGTSTGPNPPSVTASWGSADNLWLAAISHYEMSTTISSYSASYTGGRRDTEPTTTEAVFGTCYRENATATEDPGAFTLSASAVWVAQTIVFKPETGETFEFAGSETVSFDGSVSMVQTATFADSQTVSFDGTAAMIQTATMTGAEEVSFDGTADTIRNQWAFDGSEDVLFDGTAGLQQDAAFTGAESVSFDGSVALKQSAAFTGSQTVSFDGEAALDIAALVFEGAGLLSFDGSIATVNAILQMQAAQSVTFDGTASLGQEALFEGGEALSFDGIADLLVFGWDDTDSVTNLDWQDVE